MMWNHWGWGGDWGWGFFGLMHVFWWVLLVVAAVVLFRALRGGSADAGRDRALDIVRERYARGEIDLAEYTERLRQLKG